MASVEESFRSAPTKTQGRAALKGTDSEVGMVDLAAAKPHSPSSPSATAAVVAAARFADDSGSGLMVDSPRRKCCTAKVTTMIAQESALFFTVLVLLLLTGVIEWWMPTTSHAFIERDPSISMPHYEASVSSLHLFLIAFALPAAIIFVLELAIGVVVMAQPSKSQRLQPQWACGWLVNALLTALCVTIRLCIALGTNIALTNIVKVICGRPRPNFFALCNYKGYGDALEHVSNDIYAVNLTDYFGATTSGVFGDYAYCAGKASDIRQSRLSFPSGHSSIAFAGMAFLSAYCVAKFDAVRRVEEDAAERADTLAVDADAADEGQTCAQNASGIVSRVVVAILASEAMAIVVSSACMLFAAWVASTRYYEYWHHPADILAGAALGTFCALVTRHRRYWESIPAIPARGSTTMLTIERSISSRDS